MYYLNAWKAATCSFFIEVMFVAENTFLENGIHRFPKDWHFEHKVHLIIKIFVNRLSRTVKSTLLLFMYSTAQWQISGKSNKQRAWKKPWTGGLNWQDSCAQYNEILSKSIFYETIIPSIQTLVRHHFSYVLTVITEYIV